MRSPPPAPSTTAVPTGPARGAGRGPCRARASSPSAAPSGCAGRGGEVLPWSLLAIATIPAVINIGVKYITRNTPASDIDLITFRDYVGVSTSLLLFIAVTAPDLVCPDRRNRVLPLIFARPLTGSDYAFAKVGALTAILFGFGFSAQVVLFVGQMLVVEEGALDFLTQNVEVLWQVPVASRCSPCTGPRSRWPRGHAPDAPDRRRCGPARDGPRLGDGVVDPRRRRGADVENLFEDGSLWGLLSVLEIPLRITDLVFLGHVEPTSLVGGAEGAGLGVILMYLAVVAGSLGYLVFRYRASSERPARPTATAERPGVRRAGHGRPRRRVGVVRPEGGPVRGVLLLRYRGVGPARPERRGQDHAGRVRSAGCCR